MFLTFFVTLCLTRITEKWYEDRVIKFARWQHPAVGRGVEVCHLLVDIVVIMLS